MGAAADRNADRNNVGRRPVCSLLIRRHGDACPLVVVARWWSWFVETLHHILPEAAAG
jgi:hypothetical protein